MKHVLGKTLIIVTIFISSLTQYGVSKAYTSDEIAPLVESAVEQSDSRTSQLNENSSIEEVRAAYLGLSNDFKEKANKITLLKAEGDNQEQLQKKLSASLLLLANYSNTIATTNDQQEFSVAADNYDAEIVKFNSYIGEVNSTFNLSTTDYTSLLLIMLIIFSIISIGLLVASRVSNKLIPSAVIQDRLQFELFKASLWPTIGSLITFVWYISTPAGGTYYILWGPIGFGALYFIKGYSDYISQKKELKKSQKDETEEIKRIISQRAKED